MNESSLTERGQVSVPAALRKSMNLKTGERFRWEQVSDREIRVSIAQKVAQGPMSVLGYARTIRKGPARSTQDWMKELRSGEGE
jgi:AbrB family looped-hinge helix DNA binding protein